MTKLTVALRNVVNVPKTIRGTSVYWSTLPRQCDQNGLAFEDCK